MNDEDIQSDPLVAIKTWQQQLAAELWAGRLLVAFVWALIVALIVSPILSLVSGNNVVGWFLGAAFSFGWTIYWSLDNGQAGEVRVPKFLGTYFARIVQAGPEIFPFGFTIDRVSISTQFIEGAVVVLAGREGGSHGRFEVQINYKLAFRLKDTTKGAIRWLLTANPVERVRSVAEEAIRKNAALLPVAALAESRDEIATGVRDAMQAQRDLVVEVVQVNITDIAGAGEKAQEAIQRPAITVYETEAASKRAQAVQERVKAMYEALGGAASGVSLDNLVKSFYLDALNDPSLISEHVNTINIQNLAIAASAFERIAGTLTGRPHLDLGQFKEELRAAVRDAVREEAEQLRKGE
jgi:hypothetical protein